MKNIQKKTATALATTLAILMPAVSSAANNDLRINGFLTVGAGQALDDETSVAGYDDSISFNNDTVLGLQFTKPINDKVTLNAQLTGRGGEPGYDLKATWAFASIQATDELTLRAGRIRLPAFMFSEYTDVSYAYPWIRLPKAFDLNFSDIDGIDALYETYVGDASLSLESYIGRYEVSAYELAVENMMGVVATANINSLTARLSIHSLALTANKYPDGSGSTFAIDSDNASFLEAGLIYDDSSNFAFAEYTAATFPDDFVLKNSYSTIIATYGYRFGSLMPHITYDTRNTPDTDLTETSIIGGVRWDLAPSTSIKVQYQMDDNDNNGAKTNGSLISTSLDLVF